MKIAAVPPVVTQLVQVILLMMVDLSYSVNDI